MSKGNIKSLCRSVLPENFNATGRAIDNCQQVLDGWLPERLHGMVQVVNVSAGAISISATTPVVANYLRLHLGDLQQALGQSLGSNSKVQIKTLPASVSKVTLAQRPAPPQTLRPSTISALSAGANAIEDDKLREALQSLARTLKTKSHDTNN